MVEPRIAILGATGYIGRSLLHECVARGLGVAPFARDIQRSEEVFGRFGIQTQSPRSYQTLLEEPYDVIVNAAGIGSPRTLAASGQDIFEVTESIDRMLLDYLGGFPRARVFHLSSGAVFGLRASEAIVDGTRAVFAVDKIESGCYGVAKLASEARHRIRREYAIIDLRVFSFFSRFADLEDKFLLSEIAAALVNKTVFKTSADDLVRDFTTARGLLDLILFFADLDPTNLAIDVQTRAPVSKLELLAHFQANFGLETEEISTALVSDNPTGRKSTYFSRSTALSKLGFSPKETSLQGIDREMRALLAK